MKLSKYFQSAVFKITESFWDKVTDINYNRKFKTLGLEKSV